MLVSLFIVCLVWYGRLSYLMPNKYFVRAYRLMIYLSSSIGMIVPASMIIHADNRNWVDKLGMITNSADRQRPSNVVCKRYMIKEDRAITSNSLWRYSCKYREIHNIQNIPLNAKNSCVILICIKLLVV